MTRRLQAGDTSAFAVAITILQDPEPQQATSLVLESWGRLELWVAGRNLTEHRDRAEGLHEAITWYLRPVVGWLVGLKTSLRDDLAPPIPVRVDFGTEYLAHGPAPDGLPKLAAQRWNDRLWRWRQRHALSAARRGGVFPEITFRRAGDDVEISWDADNAPSRSGCRFLEAKGSWTFEPSLIESVLSELEELARGALGNFSSIQPTEAAGELQRSLRAELANRDTRWLVDEQRRLGPIGLVVQGLDPDLGRGDARALVDLASKPVRELAVEIDSARFDAPWQEGYVAALGLRERLGINGDPLTSVTDLIQGLGIQLTDITISDAAVRAITMFGEDLGTGAVVGWNRQCPFNDGEIARGASQLQGVGHLLLDRTRAGRVGFAHGSDWTGRRPIARANAFAAMMLAPPEALRGLEPTAQSLQEHCQRLSASPRLLAQHAANLGFLSRGIAEGLIESECGE